MKKIAVIALGIVSSSCLMMLRGKKSTYELASEQEVAGVKIRLQMKPEGTANGSFSASAMVVGAAYAKLQGPFVCRFYAYGKDGKQEWFTVNQIDTRTVGSNRTERYPSKELGRVANFKWRKDRSDYVAVYPVPSQFKVLSKEDGALEVRALVTVKSQGKLVQKSLLFRMNPVEKPLKQNIFIPKEIVDSMNNREKLDDAQWD